MKLIKSTLTLTLVAFVIGMIASACSSKKETVPTNKKEIIDQFIAGTLDPSYVPVLFWGHFGR